MTNRDKPRTALYCRVSTDEQGRSGYSIPDQKRALAEYAERMGWGVVETVVDDGCSGGDASRPGLRIVLGLAAEGKIDVVVATKRDRFFRSRLYRLLTERDLTEMGVRMVALDDTSNRLADDFLDSFAEFERDQIKERTMRGLAQKARSGRVIRSSWRPYGFRWTDEGCGLAVEPEEMAVVVRLFGGLAEGRTGRSITSEFEEEGVPSPAGLPRWNQRTVTNLLRGDLYYPRHAEEVAPLVSPEVAASLDPAGSFGLWVYNKHETSRRREWDPEKGAFVIRHTKKRRPEGERLAVPVPLDGSGLDRALVAAARDRAAARARRPSANAGRDWVLKGVLRCAECGMAIGPHTVKRRLKDGSPGKDSHYYQCRQKHRDGPRECGNTKNFPAAPLERAVWEAVYDLLRDPERLKVAYKKELLRLRDAHHGRNPDKEARTLAEQIAGFDRMRRNYQDQAAEGLMTLDELRDRLVALAKQRRKAEAALEEARGRGDAVERLRRDLVMLCVRLDQIERGDLRHLRPGDQRQALLNSRTTAEIDREGNVTITGMLDLDMTELLPTDEVYEIRPGGEEPQRHKGVVKLGSTPSASSA